MHDDVRQCLIETSCLALQLAQLISKLCQELYIVQMSLLYCLMYDAQLWAVLHCSQTVCTLHCAAVWHGHKHMLHGAGWSVLQSNAFMFVSACWLYISVAVPLCSSPQQIQYSASDT